MTDESNVVDLDDHRPQPTEYDGLMCRCGSGWFELVEVAGHERLQGMVCLSADGRITGYSGRLFCYDCGAEVTIT